MTTVLLVNNRVHQIFTDGTTALPARPNKEVPHIIVAPDDVKMGAIWNPQDNTFFTVPPMPTPKPRKGYSVEVVWNDETRNWDTVYTLDEAVMSLHILDTMLGVNHE